MKARSNLLTKAQTSYTYDLLGNVTNILAADGTTTEYEYNADGEVVSELVRNIAYSGEADEENHYSTLANTSSKPFVATAIRYTEDAINANKGSGFAKLVPKTPAPAKPKVTPQEYAKARKQATTPTQAEYVQLRKSGINMSYGQYVNEKQQARFPSYGQYAYDRSVGKPTYQTFGAVQVVNHQSGTAYYKTPTVTAEATPKVESVDPKQTYGCSAIRGVLGGVVYARSLPPTGEPGSEQTLNNPDGSPKQKRWYGEDGKPIRDRDYNHSGKDIPFPHDHEWKDGERQKEHLPPSQDYNISLNSIIGECILIVGVVSFALLLDDATGIGVIDDFLLGPIGAIISKGLEMVAA